MGDKTSTAKSWADITPSDTASIEPTPQAVRVNGAGDVVAVGADGVSCTFTAVDGDMLMIQPVKIMATGTTATGLIALYN